MHPLIGEGMSMALQSAFLLAGHLTEQPPRAIDASARAGDSSGLSLRLARCVCTAPAPCGNLRPHRDAPGAEFARSHRLLGVDPQFLTAAAHLAGKARKPVAPLAPTRKELHEYV